MKNKHLTKFGKIALAVLIALAVGIVLLVAKPWDRISNAAPAATAEASASAAAEPVDPAIEAQAADYAANKAVNSD